MKILFHYNDYAINVNRQVADSYGGVGYYRIIKVAEQLKKSGMDVTVIGGVGFNKFGETIEEKFDNIFKEYDVLWTPYFYNDQSAAAMYFMRDKHKKKVVMDIDDNYLDVPENNPLFEEFKSGKKKRAFLSTALFFADHIVASTYPLKERLQDHFKSVHGTEKDITVIPNMNDVNDWNYKKKTTKTFTIGYAGSTSHLDDLAMVLPAIVEVMTNNPSIEFHMIGLMPKKTAESFFRGVPQNIRERMVLVGATDTFPDYPSFLAKQGFDIGIAPLVDTAFTRSKSSIKWFEYSMFKIPVVASRVYPYFMDVKGRKTIQDGVTGLLCRTRAEWVTALNKLIADKELRKKIGQQAYEFVKEYWQYDDSVASTAKKMLSV